MDARLEREGATYSKSLRWSRVLAGLDESFDEERSQALLERVMAILAARRRRRAWFTRLLGFFRRKPKKELPVNVLMLRRAAASGPHGQRLEH